MIKKYNLEIMTVIFLVMIVSCLLSGREWSRIQWIMMAYMFLFTLHEWEETRFPGGFTDLMVKFFGEKTTEDKLATAHIPVAVLLIVITFVPFFSQLPVLVLVPVYLGVFEMFIHVAGIKIHKMDKPYTPGMATAIILGITSVFVLITFSKEQLLSTGGYLLGVPLTLLCFAAMQRTVLAIYGLSYGFVLENVKKRFKGTA